MSGWLNFRKDGSPVPVLVRASFGESENQGVAFEEDHAMTGTPHQGTTSHDTGTVPDFDIAPGRVGTEHKRAEEASAAVELLRLADKALSIDQDKPRQCIERAIAPLGGGM